MRVSAWEERSDGSPAAKRGLKQHYGVYAVIIPHPAKPGFKSLKRLRGLFERSEWSQQGEAAVGAYLRVSGS